MCPFEGHGEGPSWLVALRDVLLGTGGLDDNLKISVFYVECAICSACWGRSLKGVEDLRCVVFQALNRVGLVTYGDRV